MALGIWQLVLILLVIMILFGAGRLPQVMADIGKGIVNLRKILVENKASKSEENEKEKSI